MCNNLIINIPKVSSLGVKLRGLINTNNHIYHFRFLFISGQPIRSQLRLSINKFIRMLISWYWQLQAALESTRLESLIISNAINFCNLLIVDLFLSRSFNCRPYVESDTPSKIISKYQLAARYGRTENANCGQQYDDCIINFLDIVKSVTNLLL